MHSVSAQQQKVPPLLGRLTAMMLLPESG